MLFGQSTNCRFLVAFGVLGLWVDCTWNLPRGVVFPFYQCDKESEKKFHFIHHHNNNVEGLLLAIMLTTNKKNIYVGLQGIYVFYFLHVPRVSLFVFTLCLSLFLESHMTMKFVGFLEGFLCTKYEMQIFIYSYFNIYWLYNENQI